MELLLNLVVISQVSSLDEGFEEWSSFFTFRRGLAFAFLGIFQSRFYLTLQMGIEW
jgi:hypothetical protein